MKPDPVAIRELRTIDAWFKRLREEVEDPKERREIMLAFVLDKLKRRGDR